MSLFLAADRLATLRKRPDFWQARWLSFALLMFCLSASVLTIAEQVAKIDRIGEADFGDNYVLHTILRFQKTGVIYEPPGTSDSIPAISQYSPMLYILLSLPGLLMPVGNPFIGPRLIEITAFLLCVAVTASIARALVPHASACRWSLLLALSIESMRVWILQLRGDFPGIAFSLISIRLLLSRSRWCVLLAGAAAGIGTQFKFVCVSAIAAGLLWLTVQRRWKSVAEFAGSALAASLGIYFLFLQHQPQMFSQMFVLRHTIIDYRELLVGIVPAFLGEPVVLLGAAAIPLVALRGWTRWGLLVAYLGISLVLSTALDLQAGGNINYFFEAMFALVPLSAFGALQLGRCRFGTAGLFLCGLLVFVFAVPRAHSAYSSIRHGRAETAAWNRHMDAIHHVFQGNHVLSTVPNATYLATETVIDEPFLLSYLERLGEIDLQPLRERIRQREFDIVVTLARAGRWRGVTHLPLSLRPAIAEAYQPLCVFEGWLIQLPRQSPHPGLAEQFSAIGCAPPVARDVSDNAW